MKALIILNYIRSGFLLLPSKEQEPIFALWGFVTTHLMKMKDCSNWLVLDETVG